MALLADFKLTKRLGKSRGKLNMSATKLLFFAPSANEELNVKTAALQSVKSNPVIKYSVILGIDCGNQKFIRIKSTIRKKEFTTNWYKIFAMITALGSTKNL